MTLIARAWKGAITILTLRYLFLGRSSLVPYIPAQPSPRPSASHGSAWLSTHEETSSYFQNYEEFNFSDFLEDTSDPENFSSHLSTGVFMNDPLSRTPSPFPSPLPFTEPLDTGVWNDRYKLHDEAFTLLSESFSTLHDRMEGMCLRNILVPLLILALVSRRGSSERELCHSYFQKFHQYMAENHPPEPSSYFGSAKGPQGTQMEFNVPWEKLDAYSDAIEGQLGNSLAIGIPGLTKGATEWNWWDMLNHLKMELICEYLFIDIAPSRKFILQVMQIWSS